MCVGNIIYILRTRELAIMTMPHLSQSTDFELTFLGLLGGPIEGLTSALLIKPTGVAYPSLDSRHLLCVDGGLGLALLTEIVNHEKTTRTPMTKTLQLYGHDPNGVPQDYCCAEVTIPFSEMPGPPFEAAQGVMDQLDTYIITHPHLDHIAGLVINSLGFSPDKPKHIYGLLSCMEALLTHVFNGVIWPKMPQLKLVTLNSLELRKPVSPNGFYTVVAFELSHGVGYQSLAYLISYEANPGSFPAILVFGDFELDRLSGGSLNRDIWRLVAPLVGNRLKAIVLECSHGNSIEDEKLYGHIKLADLIGELCQLREEVNKVGGSMAGLHVVVNHLKELHGNVRIEILDQLRQGIVEHDLDVRLLLGLTGVSLKV